MCEIVENCIQLKRKYRTGENRKSPEERKMDLRMAMRKWRKEKRERYNELNNRYRRRHYAYKKECDRLLSVFEAFI